MATLGFDTTESKREGLLGFSLHRTDHTEDERYWLQGYKVFDLPGGADEPGDLVSTQKHPVQDFVWGDYTAKPGHKYTYTVVPQYGTPGALEPGPKIELDVQTERVDMGKHAIHFNRGVAGSQAYARKFKNRHPDNFCELDDDGTPIPFSGGAYEWLSRGLAEAMAAFIQQATDNRYSIRAALYEFSYHPVGQEFADARTRGVDVEIVLDLRDNNSDSSRSRIKASKANLTAAKFPANRVHGRTTNPSYISHNKFIVLLKDGKPIQVWTGSTNVTRGGIYGQSNVGHVVRDKSVARQFLEYWERLKADPEAKELRQDNYESAADFALDPLHIPPKGISCVFSPRTSKAMLHWYAALAAKAEQSMCFTAAFGVNELFYPAFQEDRDFLRFVALESYGNGKSAQAKFKAAAKSFDKDVLLALGSVLDDLKGNPGMRTFLKESLTGLNVNVRYLHTKYLLVDPLSADPIVVSGSANFSLASTTNNDENMLVIRGDKAVADVYFGEFMRLFDHFRFRDFARRLKPSASDAQKRMAYLRDDDSWTEPFFSAESSKAKLRRLFAKATV